MTGAGEPRSFRRTGREPLPANPRRVRGGLRLSATTAELQEHWPAMEVLALLDRLMPADRREEGLAYARSGQTVRMELREERIEAAVQGRRRTPYLTQLEVRGFTAGEWRRLIDVMAEQAVFAATLPTGELPGAMREVMARLQLALVPVEAREVIITCECNAIGPCKHAAAVLHLLAEQFKRRPGDVFLLRGLAPESVVDRLARHRSVQTRGYASAHHDPFVPAAQRLAPPLEMEIDDFWRLGEIPPTAEIAHAPHALLRRLGPSPMKGRFPIVGLLASIYDEVSAAAKLLRDETPAPLREETPGDERDDDEGDDDHADEIMG